MVSSTSAQDTSHQITREEIRLTIQLQIMAMYRRTFILEEFNRVVEQSRVGLNDADSRLLYDVDKLRCLVNSKLRLHRTVIRRRAYHIDNMLYSYAATMEEYCCLEDLEERVNMVVSMDQTI
jgi:hypothetical protein